MDPFPILNNYVGNFIKAHFHKCLSLFQNVCLRQNQQTAYQIMLMTLRSEMNIIQTRYPARVTWKSCTDIGADLASNQDTNYSIYLYSEKGWKIINKKLWNYELYTLSNIEWKLVKEIFPELFVSTYTKSMNWLILSERSDNHSLHAY